MGWGKTLLAGLGGLVVGGPVGAAIAAGAAHAGSKIMEAKKEAQHEKEKVDDEVLKTAKAKEDLESRRAKLLQERVEAEAAEERRLQEEREKAEVEAAEANAQREQLLIAMLAVGMAAGSVDGPMPADSRYELEQAMDMVKESGEFPAAVLAKQEEYNAKAPTFMKAKKEVEKLQNPDLRLFRALIDNILHSDGVISPKEKDFLEKWNHFFPEE